MRILSLALFGRFEVQLDGVLITGFTYNKLRALLAYLALEPAHAHSRSHLAALFWPDVTERLARQNLSQALAILRTLLGSRSSSPVPFLLITSDTVQLNPRAVWNVDVTRFTALLSQVAMHDHRGIHMCTPCIERLRAAVALYIGDLLPQVHTIGSDGFEEWVQILREQLRRQVIGALERLTYAAEWREQYSEALVYAQRQIELAPVLEVNMPSRKPVLRQPLLLANSLYVWERVSITARQPDGDRMLYINELPTQMHSYAQDLAVICARLRAGQTRCLTIIGVPGIGKTTLAFVAARVLRFDFAHGVCLVDLADVRDPIQLAIAIAHALSLPNASDIDTLEALTAQLYERHLLLVLDGCDRVPDAAPFIAALLATCPALSILATSRAPLRIRAEQRCYLSASAQATF